jgi:hypothetical protein
MLAIKGDEGTCLLGVHKCETSDFPPEAAGFTTIWGKFC